PSLTHAQWLRLGELAFAVVLVLYAESYGSIRSFALKHGDTVQANRDLFALGLANLLSGLGHGSPVGAGYSGTAANEAAGAQTRWAGVVAALVILAAVLTLLPMIAWTPEPVLAAVVVHAVSHSLRPAQLRPYFAWQRDRTVLLAAIAAVLVLGVLDGLLVAIAASLLFALRELAQARVSELGRADDGHTFLALAAHPDAVREPQLLILRPEAPLFFGNVERLLAEVRRLVNAHPDARGVILSLEESPDLDSSSIEALGDLALALQRHGRMLHLTRLKDPVYTVLCRADLPALGKDCLSVLSVDDAVRAARSALGITHP
ncbi:MAG: SulP family inorganic anion transporter, partial [Betaproteobacteria bacterium]|nr:SulP family inorganic anion transporter [Betaproteobacteria bacterium]